MPSLLELASQRQVDIQDAIRRAEEATSSTEVIRILLGALRQIQEAIQDINIDVDEVEVSNLSDIRAHIRNELRIAQKPILEAFGPVIKAIQSIPKPLPFPKMPEPKDFPSSIRVSNFPTHEPFQLDLSEVLDSLNSIKDGLMVLDRDLPTPEVKVDLPETSVNVDLAPMLEGLGRIIEGLKPLQLLSRKATKPISVRMTDGRNFIRAIQEVRDGQNKQVTAFASNRGINQKEFLAAQKALSQASSAKSNTKVTVGATSTSVVSANASRVSLTLVNDSNEEIYVSKSGTAISNEGIRLNANGGSIIITDYTGAVTAISTSGSKNLTVCEV